MKNLLLALAVLLAASPALVLAQADGSAPAGGAVEALSQAQIATTSAPQARPDEAADAADISTDEPSGTDEVATSSTTTAAEDAGVMTEPTLLAPTTSTPLPPEPASSLMPDLPFIPLLAAAVVLGVAVAWWLRARRAQSGDAEEKTKEDCDSIKSLIEHKKRELEESLRAWPTDKLRSMAKSTVVSRLKRDDDAREVIETVESIQAKQEELQRAIELLQTRFDLCMLSLPTLGTPLKAVIFEFESAFTIDGMPSEEMVAVAQEIKKSKVKIATFSNAPRESEERYHIFAWMHENIDKQYKARELGAPTDPAVFKKILADLGVKPGECLYFDASEANINAAASVGIAACAFTTPNDARTLIKERL